MALLNGRLGSCRLTTRGICGLSLAEKLTTLYLVPTMFHAYCDIRNGRFTI